MKIHKLVVIPVRYNPVSVVWLPENRHLDELLALPLHGGGESEQRQVVRKVESWGVPPNVQRAVRYDGLTVWVCWIAPDAAPAGLEQVPIWEARRHPTIGPLVSDVRQRLIEDLARRRPVS